MQCTNSTLCIPMHPMLSVLTKSFSILCRGPCHPEKLSLLRRKGSSNLTWLMSGGLGRLPGRCESQEFLRNEFKYFSLHFYTFHYLSSWCLSFISFLHLLYLSLSFYISYGVFHHGEHRTVTEELCRCRSRRSFPLGWPSTLRQTSQREGPMSAGTRLCSFQGHSLR